MPSISVPAAIVAGSAISAGGSLIGGMMSSGAGKAQASATRDAAQLQYMTGQQIREDLQPFVQAGYSALPMMQDYIPQSDNRLMTAYQAAQGAIPKPMTQEELIKTPGYQWALGQGQRAIQSAAAARGLGVSGSALKGAATYATGLADQTYQNQFAIAQKIYEDYTQQFKNMYDLNTQGYYQRANLANLGENAAAQAGQSAVSAANAAGTSLGNAAAAQAAGTNAMASSLANAGNTAGNALTTYAMMNNLGGGGGKYLTSSGYTNTAPVPQVMPIIPPSAPPAA